MFTIPVGFFTPAAAAYDPDAQTYIDAVIAQGGTLSTSDKGAINTLFTSLKSAGLYSKMVAMYPIMGGVANAHSLNAINPVAATGAFYLNFGGGWTHDANGMKGNGSTNTANTYMINSVDFTLGDRHLSVYTNTVSTSANLGYDWGGGAGAENVLIVRYSNDTMYSGFGAFATYANTSNKGFYLGQVKGGTQTNAINGTVVVATPTSGDTDVPSRWMSIGCDNRSDIPSFSNGNESSQQRYAFASAGAGLTNTEISDLSTIVTAFQTTLGRQ